MDELTQDEIKRRCEAYPRLIEALTLTTTALERSHTPGAEYRVKENQALLKKLGLDDPRDPIKDLLGK